MSEYGLRGLSALVTGGSHGIGLAISNSLAQQGVNVAILARTAAELEIQKIELKTRGIDVISLVCDVFSEDAVDEAWSSIESQWGGVDILINNVGGGGRWGSDDIVGTPPEVWSEVYRKNVGATIQLTRLAITRMKKQRWGRVIAITSIFGEEVGGRPWFNMAKAAQTTFIKNLSQNKEFIRAGITFNCVAPGSILIPDTGWDKLRMENPDNFRNFVEELPLGRLGNPDEVASLVTFLCSKQAGYINGASILIDGGESLSLRKSSHNI